MNLPEKIYTKKEVERARDKAQVIGFLQGAGVVAGGAILWNLLGWVPMILGVIAVGWVLMKLLSSPKSEGE